MSNQVAARSYRPGEWFGIFGTRATVVLPPSEKSRVAELWAMVDDGAGFDEVLDVLISSGLRDLPGFVLVSTADGQTKVVLRGAARASFTAGGQSVDLDGSSAATWVEQSLTGVTRMLLTVGEDGEAGHDLQIDEGLVRVSAVAEPPETDDADQPDDEPAAFEPAALGEGSEDSEPDDEQPGEQPDEQPEHQPAEDPVEELTAAEEPDDDPTGQVAAVAPEPAVPPAMPQPTPPGDHDGQTHGGWPHPEERPPSAIAGQPPAPAVTRPVARLVFSSGDAVDVDRAVLVGRSPEARRFSTGDQPRLVPVPSPAQEISSTHLEIRPGAGADHGTAVVTDLGSTNGTVLVQPGLPPEDLRPGIAVQLIPGAIIDLGDGVTIQVINP